MVAPGQRVEIVDWDPAWADRFATTAADVADAFMDVEAIDHVGSTSVPGLAAKPVIDLLVTVSDIAVADAAVEAMARLGWDDLLADEALGSGPAAMAAREALDQRGQ